MKDISLYWAAIAQLLYERCRPSGVAWKTLSDTAQLAWVKIAQEAKKMYDSQPK